MISTPTGLDDQLEIEVLHKRIAALQAELDYSAGQRRDLRRQNLVLQSFAQCLLGSWTWKLLQPIRAIRNLLQPRGFDEKALLPWQQLEADREHAGLWTATGPDAQFIVPCALPAGWLHVCLKMRTDHGGRWELFTTDEAGQTKRWSESIPADGRIDREIAFPMSRPALALRFHPLNRPGRFHLERFEVVPVSSLLAATVRERVDVKRSLTVAARNSMARKSKKSMPIVYVLKGAGLCGGVKVVLEQASRLHERGFDVRVFFLTGDVGWFSRPVPAVRFAGEKLLRKALGRFRGIKVATWHETAPWVADSLKPGDRGYYLIQDIEDCYGTTLAESAAALATYRLGLKPIVNNRWVCEQLRHRFGLDAMLVGIGVNTEEFRPLSLPRDPHLILTQARTHSGGGATGSHLKGWETAKKTVLRCFQENRRTWLATFSLEDRPRVGPVPHCHFQAPSDEQLAELYNRARLFLLTSRHEGFGLPAAEAMACGCPVVATRAGGNEEFCLDGVTALTANVDDVEQLARCCLQFQSDPSFAWHVAAKGRSLIQSYNWDRVIDRLEREFFTDPKAATGNGFKENLAVKQSAKPGMAAHKAGPLW